jgi:phosphohistidine phosphatase
MTTNKDPHQLSPIRQASAIPFRRHADRLEFCLITSARKQKWGFPKGVVDPGETDVETALKESREEAGLHGEIIDPPLGEYDYAKWGTKLTVAVLLMKVARCDEEWDESEIRERRWVDPEEASALLARRVLRKFLSNAVDRLS